MTKVRRNRTGCNGASPASLPLFAYAEAERARLRWQLAPLPARTLARRYGLPLDRAALVAGLAGLGARDER